MTCRSHLFGWIKSGFGGNHQRPQTQGHCLLTGGDLIPLTQPQTSAPVLLLAALHPATAALKETGDSVFSFSLPSQVWRNEFISAPCFGLEEMKYNGGGPGAWWGDVRAEGKQLFVCLSLTLGLPFISLQGCRAVFTLGQLFSAPPSALSLPPPFHAVFKSITG